MKAKKIVKYFLLFEFMKYYIGISVPSIPSNSHLPRPIWAHTPFIPFSLTMPSGDQQQKEVSVSCCKVYMATMKYWPELAWDCLQMWVVTPRKWKARSISVISIIDYKLIKGIWKIINCFDDNSSYSCYSSVWICWSPESSSWCKLFLCASEDQVFDEDDSSQDWFFHVA